MATSKGQARLDFRLPPELEASAPPEARGLARDEVRLIVSYRREDRVEHTRFRDLERYLAPGDLLVINTSGTLNAALLGRRSDGRDIEIHLSTHLPDDRWIVEVRLLEGHATIPFYGAQLGERLTLSGGGTVTLDSPYSQRRSAKSADGPRLWVSTVSLPGPWEEYLERHGFPIRYSYVAQRWSSRYYQTVYATEQGSAEMPSAGRAFSAELITRLVARGVRIAPVMLHTGVASAEDDEAPYDEYYRVSAETAQLVNLSRQNGKRVVAVGTTVVRALETVADPYGLTHPDEGWTSLVITPERRLRAIDALLTGLHEPRASHLGILLALAGPEHVAAVYDEALRHRYLWHEFGDLHLLLP